jgi:hypothetical protein
MSAGAAWAVTALCIAVVAACIAELFMRQRSSLRRVAVVMGVTLAIDIAVAELVPWALMWLPLMASHLIAAHVVMMRPANRTHVIVGVLYAVLAAVDVAFALHGNKALAWSPYMDMVNAITIAQAGALLIGVLFDGHISRRRVTRRAGGAHIQSSSHMGIS